MCTNYMYTVYVCGVCTRIVASPVSRSEILSLGSVNADFQVRIPHRPEVSETLLAHDFVRLGGGKAANVAYLARRLGVDATLLARVGDDALKEQALQPLRDVGVNLTHVRVVEGSPTGVSMITVPPDGKKGIVLASNANDRWYQTDTAEVREVIESAAAGSVLVVDYEVPPSIVEGAVEAAHACSLPIILDPSPADRVEREPLAKVNLLVPNTSEAKGLTGISVDSVDDAVRAARRLLERGVERVGVKLSGGGCVLASRDSVFHIPALPVEVVDTTGAGDAFAGALAVAVLEGRTPLEAACFAVAASHLTVTGYGSQPAYPTREELEEPYRRLLEGAHELES